MDKLRSCPFCGHDEIKEKPNPYGVQGYFIDCDKCSAQVLSLVSIDDAREKWNRRV